MDEEKKNIEAAQENEAPKQEAEKKAPPFPHRSAIRSIRNFGAGTREDRFRLRRQQQPEIGKK